jgi:hypothetical protein
MAGNAPARRRFSVRRGVSIFSCYTFPLLPTICLFLICAIRSGFTGKTFFSFIPDFDCLLSDSSLKSVFASHFFTQTKNLKISDLKR